MKSFDALTQKQQAKAIQKCLERLVEGILEGFVRFNDEMNGDGLQAAIDAAIAEAGRLQTPWFAGEIILHKARFKPMDGHVTDEDGLWPVREALEGMARCRAEDALYAEPGEDVLTGIAA